jgi:hypothetical protein
MQWSVTCCCALLICLWSFVAEAQTKPPNASSPRLPRVGTIKDYPATGLTVGCGNLYFYLASKARATDASYGFLSRGDGSNAWMNLNGRDVRLRQIKSSAHTRRASSSHRKGATSPENPPTLIRFSYRVGALRISVVIEDFKPRAADIEEGDSMFKMTITLRQGASVRVVHAIGDSDC